MHKYDHDCSCCKHGCLHFCPCCDKVYCCKCSKEWVEVAYYPYTTAYPWPNTTWTFSDGTNDSWKDDVVIYYHSH